MIERLKDAGWSDEPQDDTKEEVRSCLVTAVSSKAVVDAGLVKKQVVIGGYESIMETMLDEMLDAMATTPPKAGADRKLRTQGHLCLPHQHQSGGRLDRSARPPFTSAARRRS